MKESSTMLALLLTALLTGASAQECIKDSRVQALTEKEMQAREEIQGFSKDGMWKMPKVAQHATEEVLEDCGSCTDAEVQVELMMAQMGENPSLNEIEGIYYPVQNMYAPNGFKLSYRDIPHEVPHKVKTMLEHRFGTLELDIKGYRQFDSGDAERLNKADHHEELAHLAPGGLGPYFQLAKAPEKDKHVPIAMKAAQKSFAEFATHMRALTDIDKTVTKASGAYLVLEENFVIAPNFKANYKRILSEAPKDWDILFLKTGPSKNTHVRCEDKVVGSNMFEMRRPVSTPDGNDKFYQGIDGYIVRRQSLSKVLRFLRQNKAAPLTELLMSVHSEEKKRRPDGKIDYNVDGIYTYVVNEHMLEKVEVPKPFVPGQAAATAYTPPVQVNRPFAAKKGAGKGAKKKSLLQKKRA